MMTKRISVQPPQGRQAPSSRGGHNNGIDPACLTDQPYRFIHITGFQKNKARLKNIF